MKTRRGRPGRHAGARRTALTMTHLSIRVATRRPDLGLWQGIFPFEHRTRPHERRITRHLIGQ
jgi:thiamine phosphate synthase YjbQ (UPF0047 family)